MRMPRRCTMQGGEGGEAEGGRGGRRRQTARWLAGTPAMRGEMGAPVRGGGCGMVAAAR